MQLTSLDGTEVEVVFVSNRADLVIGGLSIDRADAEPQNGMYNMGSVISNDEQPIHKVELSSFYIGQTEVTQALWRVVMADSPVNVACSEAIGIGDDYLAY